MTRENKKQLRCNIDGNALHIFREDFTNLAESPSVFIELGNETIRDIYELAEEDHDYGIIYLEGLEFIKESTKKEVDETLRDLRKKK